MGDNSTPKPEVNGEIEPFTVTQTFLEFAFERKVKKFEVNMGTNPGDNYLSIMHGVEVLFEGESAPNHYLIKCYPNHPARRDFLDQVNVFEKELFMYSDFFPQLKQMVIDCGANNEVVGLVTAPFHGGNTFIAPSEKFKDTEWSKENFLIMTDLRKSKFKMADRMSGLDLDHAKLVIKEMAKFHALGWAYRIRNNLPRLSSKYPSLLDNMYTNDSFRDDFEPLMVQIRGNSLKAAEDALGSDHIATKAFKKLLESDTHEIMKSFMYPYDYDEEHFENMLRIKPENDGRYNKELWLTGTHGDCWINNMLFRYEEGQLKPLSVAFVDFQVYREVCPTMDLAYFFSSSIRAPIRIPNKNELLKTYHDAFAQYCKLLGVVPFPDFSLETLKRRYRRAELFGILVALPILSVVLKPPEEAVDLEKAEINDTVDMFSTVLEGADKNTKFMNEIAASVLNMYNEGVI